MSARKERRTFTLDPELAAYLDAMVKELQKDSVSSALEEILRESKHRRDHQRIRRAISKYYDCLTEAERNEERVWGEFSESQLSEE